MRWTKEAKRPSTTPTTVETQKLEFIGRFENISNKNFFLGKKIPVNTERERTIIVEWKFQRLSFCLKVEVSPYGRL